MMQNKITTEKVKQGNFVVHFLYHHSLQITAAADWFSVSLKDAPATQMLAGLEPESFCQLISNTLSHTLSASPAQIHLRDPRPLPE